MKLSPRISVLAFASAITWGSASAASGHDPGALYAPIQEATAPAEASWDADVPVFVRLTDAPAARVFAAERQRYLESYRYVFSGSREDLSRFADQHSASLAMSSASQLKAKHAQVIDILTSRFGATVLFNSRFADNGVAVLVPANSIEMLRQIPGVSRVTKLEAHELHAASSLDFTGVRTFWDNTISGLDLRGEGIGVGVVDTGIDHMHTALSGPGGTAYATGATTATAYPTPPTTPVAANFPTPKVVWGYDFVGDAYNAAGTSNAALIPVPDLNSMDTNGHGTAVASLMAGLGANADGTTYTGGFDASAPNVDVLRVSPGYAPAANLYAFRVFGTSGSTLLASSAVDAATAIYLWQANPAVAWDGEVVGTVFNQSGQPVTVTYNLPQPPETPRLRVVNLSLGSNAGDIEESSAAAVQTAADAGLIMVLSAGNADDSYYITGAPGVATGGISVAASFNNAFPAAFANAPANGAQVALNNFAITGFTTAVFSNVGVNIPLTGTIWAKPNLADYTAPAPAGYTPPTDLTVNPPVPDLSPLVTLRDGAGQPINLFSVDGGGNLVVTNNPAATNPYAGKVVLIDRGGVGFHQKVLAAERAGALAAVIVSSTTAALGNMAANVNLPNTNISSIMVTQAIGAQFADGGGVNTGVARTVEARPGLQILAVSTNASRQDLIAAYSSRGPRRTDDGIKPDVTAPAENVAVASATSGNAARPFDGTSSAAPHTAGAMTLLFDLHQDWSNYELKALLLNSTANDIYTTAGPDIFTAPSGQTWGVARQGVGRWDLGRYENGGNQVIMFANDQPATDGGAGRSGAVNLSFGVLDVVDTLSLDRQVNLRNKGNTAVTFNIGFQPATETPGVSFSFPGGTTVTVPANGETSFNIRLQANAGLMRHARELSLRPFQFITSTAAANRVARQFLNEASGYIQLTPASAPASGASHRLTVQAFPRRASELSLVQNTIDEGEQTLGFAGVGYNTGTNTQFVDTATFAVQPTPVDIVSFAKGFELGFAAETETSGLVTSERAGDIQHVGVTSDFGTRANPFDTATTNNQSAVVLFGVSAFGEFDTLEAGSGAEYQIDIDTNNDGVTDRMIRQFSWVNGERTNVRTNIMLPVMSTAAPFTSGSSTGFFLNVLSNVYTNLYNNSTVIIPVRVSGSATTSLGLTAANPRFKYRVRGFHRGLQVSSTPWINYDVSAPGITFPGLVEPSLGIPVSTGGSFNPLTVNVDADALQANGSQGLLMLYPMNELGSRSEAIPFVPTALEAEIFKDGFE